MIHRPVPWDFSTTHEQRKRLDEARGAFLELRDPRGRRRGSGNFETADEFESAIFRTVCALIKKSRKPAYRPSYKEIMRVIAFDHRPAGKNPLRDLDRSFT